MAKVLLWFNAIGFLGFGLVCLVMPEFPTNLSGLTLSSADAPIEIRAQYGGIFLAITAMSLLGALRVSMQRPALILLFFVYGGLAGGRLLGLLLDPGPAGGYTYSALGFELLFTLILGGYLITTNSLQETP